MIGKISTSGSPMLSIENCYAASDLVQGFANTGAVIGQIVGSLTLNSNNVLFDSELFSPSLNAIGSGTVTNGSITSVTCEQLYYNVTANFNQSIWGNDRLLIEKEFVYGVCTCAICLTTSTTPSTTPPSTNPPSTNPPSTTPPSTNPPSTTPPSTNPPSTTPPSTNPPSTTPPSTNPPSTTPPSTNPPSTTPPSTNPPSTTPPSTNPPSTTPPSTNTPSTTPPSTNPPSTTPPSTTEVGCFYQVPNCRNCIEVPIQVNTNVYNVSCKFIETKWSWVFSNKTSDTLINQVQLTVNQSTVFIEGNLNQTSDAPIVFVINRSQNSKLNVSGCVNIEGDISIVNFF